MNIAQYDLRSRGGILRSEPRTWDLGPMTFIVANAMDRPPELAFWRITNLITEGGWLPGESMNIHQTSGQVGATETPGFYIETKPGLCTGHIWASGLYLPIQTGNGYAFASSGNWKIELICIWLAALPASQ